MKRVEFFGAMGAGKSTIHTSVMKSKTTLEIINAKDEVYSILLDQIKKSSILQYYLLTLVLYTPLKHRVFSNYDFYHYLQNSESVEGFLKYFFSNLSTSNHKNHAKTLVRFNYLLKDLTDVIILQNYSNKKIIIHDESLMQRGLSFAIDGVLENIETYFDNVILPDGVVFTYIPLKVMEDRLSSRQKNNSGFSGKKLHSVDEIKKAYIFSNKVYEILLKKNINVLKLNAEDDLNYNTDKILQWINNFN